MKVKRFTATSMQKALKTVRNEMGPDAVILSNHRVNGGVEIIVAQNYEPVSAQSVVPPYDAEAQHQAPMPKPVAKYNGANSKSKAGPKSFLSDELDKLQPTAQQMAHNRALKKALPKPNKAPKAIPEKPENPWPFLSDDDRHDVEEQLQLQSQLESLKSQSHFGSSANSIPDSMPTTMVNQQPNQPARPAAISKIESKHDLQQALQNIKQQRQDGFNGNIELPSNITNHSHVDESPVKPAEDNVQANQQLIDDVRNELHDLTEMLKANAEQPAKDIQPSSFVWKKYSPNNALQAKLWTRLEGMGFEEWLIYQLLHKLTSEQDEKTAWQGCLRDLSCHLNMSNEDQLKRGGIFALVGPTGAGKTTTIAKMAVRFTLEHAGAKVGLITMDNYRLAAHDQLRTLGQILGVQVVVADQDHNLLSCIESLQECDLVLIDTAGLSPEHPMLEYQLEQLAQFKGRIHTLLTLPATSNSRVLRKVYHNYKAAHLTGCILSKVDEASSLGDAISVLLEGELPLWYITDGQRIPDDFYQANAKKLVKRVVQVAKQERQYSQSNNLAAGAW